MHAMNVIQPKIHDNTTPGNVINKNNIIEVIERQSKLSNTTTLGNVMKRIVSRSKRTYIQL